MPTPVSTVRQCLTEEAGRALDDAVAVARRRCHAQTTSLHALSALLTLPSSLLRDACSRSPSSAYSPRLLDLCVSVSLDRLPTAKSAGDDPPPISNSLMAAIKRSQANQRRQPEMYQILHNAANPISSISLIKVELKNFVISILDDPIVSRVLADAGFNSTDIKLAIIRPPAPPFPFPSRYLGAGGRSPPLFLCNLTDSGFPVGRNIPFPLPGVGDSNGDEYSRRIGEIMIKSSRRNPLLIGVCSRDSLQRFKDCVQKEKGKGVLPSTIVGLDLICVEKEIDKFLSGGGSKEVLDSMAMELSSKLEKHSGPGVVVNFGDLNVLVKDGGSEDAVNCLVSKLSSLVELFKTKMWLIGAAASYETYSKFLTLFPSIEKDWDLQLLPITSSSSSSAGLYSKSSLMGSFVPFGGFFSTPPEFRSQPFTRCSDCNQKCDQELSALTRKESPMSIADRCSSTLPSWLQMAGNATGEAKDDKAESNAKAMELQRKWDSICRRLHHASKIHSESSMAVPSIPCSLGSQLHSDDRLSSTLSSGFPSIPQTNTSSGQNLNLKPKQILHSQPQIASEIPNTLSHVSTRSSCNLNLAPEQKSPSSVSSVVTDLGLGTFRLTAGPLDQGDYKLILKKLTEKVPWQAEACNLVGQVVSHYKAQNRKRGTWVCFSGPDMVGKKRMAEALADLVFGSRDSLIDVDLSAQERISKPHLMFDPKLPNDPGVKSGRKTVIDYIAEELSKKPFSVILLENVDRVDDLLAQRSLSHAIQTGRLPDSRGREISISNAIVLMTCSSSATETAEFTEERVLEARNWRMQIVIKPVDGESSAKTSNRSYVAFRNKKQKGFIDLNLPVDEEDSRAWLEDFRGQVDKSIPFKPFDFDSLSEKLLDKMSITLENKLGKGTRLEVDEEVMAQILGAAWCSDEEGVVFRWIEEVLGGCFVEARTRLCLDRELLLRLASLRGVPVEENGAPGVRLPRVISLE